MPFFLYFIKNISKLINESRQETVFLFRWPSYDDNFTSINFMGNLKKWRFPLI